MTDYPTVEHDQPLRLKLVSKEADTWWRGLPGALSIIAAVFLSIGLVEPSIRDAFGAFLPILGVIAVLGALAHLRHIRSITTRCVVEVSEGRLKIQVNGDDLGDDIELRCGLFEDYVPPRRRQLLVAWICLSSEKRSLCIRQGLGIVDPVPEWPRCQPPAEAPLCRGAVVDLTRYLERRGIALPNPAGETAVQD